MARAAEPNFMNSGHAGWHEFMAERSAWRHEHWKAHSTVRQSILVRRYLTWKLGRSVYERSEVPPRVNELDETLLAALNSVGIKFGAHLLSEISRSGPNRLREIFAGLKSRGELALIEHPGERLAQVQSGPPLDLRLSIDPPEALAEAKSDKAVSELQPASPATPQV